MAVPSQLCKRILLAWMVINVLYFHMAAPLEAGVHAQDTQVQLLMHWAEQVYLSPNGLSMQNVDATRPQHLENLAIMLGLALRSQLGYADNDPSLGPHFMELQGKTMRFLADTAAQYGYVNDPERFWRNYAVKAIQGGCNDYARQVFKTDPDTVFIPMLLLGEAAPENTVDPYPRSGRKTLTADDIIGVWADCGNKGAQLEIHKTGEGKYEGRLLSEGTYRITANGGWQSFRYFITFESFNTGSHLNMGSWNDAMYRVELVYVDYERRPSILDAYNKKLPPVIEHRRMMPGKISRITQGLYLDIKGTIDSSGPPPFQWKK